MDSHPNLKDYSRMKWIAPTSKLRTKTEPLVGFTALNNTKMRAFKGGFIYILDSSNSSSFPLIGLVSSLLALEATGIWTSNSNGSWTDKQSSHFNTAKEASHSELEWDFCVGFSWGVKYYSHMIFSYQPVDFLGVKDLKKIKKAKKNF